jgi:protein SCO1/2
VPVPGATAEPVVAPDPRRSEPTGPGGGSNRSTLIAIGVGAVLVLVVGLVVASLQGEQGSDWAGVPMAEPLAKPPIVLTDTEGQPFDLQARTEGRVVLLFFGFLECPDICPTHLANVARAFDQLPTDVSGQVDMVFVTTDPGRDDPAAIRAYLDNFDRQFIGLYGSQAEIDEAQQLANVPVASQERLDDDREYRIDHAGQVIAFSPDGVARVQYPFGTRQADWVGDLPLLVEGKTP